MIALHPRDLLRLIGMVNFGMYLEDVDGEGLQTMNEAEIKKVAKWTTIITILVLIVWIRLPFEHVDYSDTAVDLWAKIITYTLKIIRYTICIVAIVLLVYMLLKKNSIDVRRDYVYPFITGFILIFLVLPLIGILFLYNSNHF